MILKLLLTVFAVAYVSFPAWLALIMQVPAESKVMVVPFVVQIPAVLDEYETAKPEEAVAVSFGASPPITLSINSGKVIVLSFKETPKLF